METVFLSLEQYYCEVHKQQKEMLMQTPEIKDVYSSWKIQQLVWDFTPEELSMVKAVKDSYLHMLEAIAQIRKHRKRGDHFSQAA